ncbi:MAG TPA: polymer-forming cytoskeletal protein [Candidatus Acidoferrales bacterium]|nr:polymer-forming cytoskeletal protein [Candidatus Acidoferrales bacterium]
MSTDSSHAGEFQGQLGGRSIRSARGDDTSAFSTQIPQDASATWAEERTRVAVGRNVNVSGKLIFHEPVRIEGRFRGEVRSAELVVISEDGMIEGKVFAPRLLIMGELRGDIGGCERVMLGPRAKFFGNIETRSLTICEGAYVDGNVRVIGLPAT